jgi:wyosine [tRNA(Phe)-imidazoG37] synthetase (radical SAM superfamily)
LSENQLTVGNHDRDSASMRYVYPVVSRRAGGVSVGVNLNPNNACNWRCIYCQVPQLTRGGPPPVDLELLENELGTFLDELVRGDFLRERVPEGLRRINDIAISGNGEPTSCNEFPAVVQLIARTRQNVKLDPAIKTILITNGSLMHRPAVRQGVSDIASLSGETWFKLDRASVAGILQINDTRINLQSVRDNLIAALTRCPTWLQTCWFSIDGKAPSRQDEDDYIEFVSSLRRDGYQPQGVLLYGLARQSLQPEAARLSSVSGEQMQTFADRLTSTGLAVKVTP